MKNTNTNEKTAIASAIEKATKAKAADKAKQLREELTRPVTFAPDCAEQVQNAVQNALDGIEPDATLPSVKLDEKNAVGMSTKKAEDISPENDKTWRKLNTELEKCGASHSFNLGKLCRQIVSSVYQTKDTVYATKGIKSIKDKFGVTIAKDCRDYMKVWGLEFASKTGAEQWDCTRITDKSKFGALAKEIGYKPYHELAVAWRKAHRGEGAKGGKPEYVFGAEIIKAVDKVKGAYTKKADALKDKEAKRKEYSAFLREKQFDTELVQLTLALVDSINKTGVEPFFLITALKDFLPQALEKAKLAKETK